VDSKRIDLRMDCGYFECCVDEIVDVVGERM
jgi:hypothetical protein